ncbi:MAG: hypothetical protein LBP25_05020 [Tannerellaceae bacterium]|jgi:hypothetical protein|nr:hypothetical protein [Tannerellaceae bacterium]
MKNCIDPDILHINKKERIRESRNETVKKNFRTALPVIIAFWVISIPVSFKSTDVFLTMTLFLGIGTAVWFHDEYEMLQLKRYYLYCLIMSMAILCYGICIKLLLRDLDVKFFDIGCFYPTSLLLSQKPLRWIFIKTYKREPVVDKPPIPLVDFAYTLLLYIAGFFISMFITSLFDW